MPYFAVVAALLLIAVTGPAQDGDRSLLTLWFDEPAPSWNHALPVGNGRLGAMVFGGVERERIQLNEETLWSEPTRWAPPLRQASEDTAVGTLMTDQPVPPGSEPQTSEAQ